MRDVPHIWNAWSMTGEARAGDYQPCTRVTVEKSFVLRASGVPTLLPPTDVTLTNLPLNTTGLKIPGVVVGTWRHGPARWYQRADKQYQIETEIPNVRSVTTDRSIDSDSATVEIHMQNSVNLDWGEKEETPNQWGKPGYFTWSRGETAEARARWGQSANQWSQALVPNALIRTYQGYGGHDKTLAEAVEDGNLVLSGVWLIDDVSAATGPELVLKGRDMAKLLIDQQLFPPLIPQEYYPLKYYRYTYETFKIPPAPGPSSSHDIITEASFYNMSSNDVDQPGGTVNNPPNVPVYGHKPTDAFDWSFPPQDPLNAGPGQIHHQDTFWLSEGHGSANPSDRPWIEWRSLDQEINLLYLHCWSGNYMCYVCVDEGGQWVPPEDSGHGGMVSVKKAGGGSELIPYVSKFSLNWEGKPGVNYYLPRTYRGNKVRLVFDNLVPTFDGYRVGMRKIVPLFDRTAATQSPLCFTCCPMPFVMGQNYAGYWQTRSDGEVYAFGDARIQPVHSSNPSHVHDGGVVAIEAHPDTLGYWTMDTLGRMIGHGSAHHYGDFYTLLATPDVTHAFEAKDFAPTASGNGYWILASTGEVFAFGDAVSHGGSTPTGTMPSGAPVAVESIESHPTTSGYWVLWSDGKVDAHVLPHLGDANRTGFKTTEYVHAIRRTNSGDGYWILGGGAHIQGFGDAPSLGNGVLYPPESWVNGLTWDFIPYTLTNNGYAIQHADGQLDVFGDFEYFGSIKEGQGQIRKDGNYKDYSDIIKELLLWSGFYLYRDPQPNKFPDVYGNIETTGAFSTVDLPQTMFDKTPVMQAITKIKEAVGYVFFIDDEGGARFESPNFWTQGNFDITGLRFDFMPEADERINLTDYSAHFTDTDARSEIIISTDDPYVGYNNIVVTKIIPPSAKDLRGLIKPAMWTNGLFKSAKEQKIMADLIAMHVWFARRQGSVTMLANPLISINDQVRIFERQTGETNVHYVRGVHTTHDLIKGSYTMQLTTNWMGGTPFDSGVCLSGAAHPQGNGYWLLGSTGHVTAFGDAIAHLDSNESQGATAPMVRVRSNPAGTGYWTMDANGGVSSYGLALSYGDAFSVSYDYARDEAVDIGITPSGHGYHILFRSGTILHFGDAINHGNDTPSGLDVIGNPVTSASLETHPTLDGYWVMRSDGTVTSYGGLTNYGGTAMTRYPYRSMRRTRTGNGYYLVTSGADVSAKGDGIYVGSGSASFAQGKDLSTWDILPDYQMSGDHGYGLLHGQGTLEPISSYPFYGDNGGGFRFQKVIFWALGTQEQVDKSPRPDLMIPLSEDVISFLKKTGSPGASQAATSRFDSSIPITQSKSN